jgi:tetratricopeptide (TPR) repeat protein
MYTPREDMRRLLALLKNGDSDATVQRATAIAMQYPADGVPCNIAGLALLNAGQPQSALTQFEAATARQDHYADAWHNAGVALLGLDRLAEAEKRIDTALQLEPARTPYRVSKVRVLLLSFQPEEAMSLAHQIVNDDPSSVAAKQYLAEALFDLKRFLDAIEILNSLPPDPETALTLAKCWSAMSLHHRVKAIIMPLGRQPISAANQTRAASLLTEAGEPADAIALLTHANTQSPNNPHILFNLAHALSENQQDEAAIATFEALLLQAPGHGYALYELSGLLQDSQAITARLTTCQPATHHADPLWHYGLARLYLKLGEYASALAHLRHANQIQQQRLPWREDAGPALCQQIRAMYSQLQNSEALSSSPELQLRGPTPVLITGMPRCGSTALAWQLSKDPQWHSGGEIGLLDQILQRQVATPVNLKALRTQIHLYRSELAALSGDADVVTDKLLSNGLYFGVIALLMPDMRMVRCSRDPIEHALSIFAHPFQGMPYTQSLTGIAAQFSLEEEQTVFWTEECGLQLEHVHIDELRAQPATVCARFATRAGLNWLSSQADTHSPAGSFNTLSSRQINHDGVSSRAQSGWQALYPYLTPTEKGLFDQAG